MSDDKKKLTSMNVVFQNKRNFFLLLIRWEFFFFRFLFACPLFFNPFSLTIFTVFRFFFFFFLTLVFTIMVAKKLACIVFFFSLSFLTLVVLILPYNLLSNLLQGVHTYTYLSFIQFYFINMYIGLSNKVTIHHSVNVN